MSEEKCQEEVPTFQAPNIPNSFKYKALKNQKKGLDSSEVFQHAVTLRNLPHHPDCSRSYREES